VVRAPVLARLFPDAVRQLEETLTNAWLQAQGVIRCVVVAASAVSRNTQRHGSCGVFLQQQVPCAAAQPAVLVLPQQHQNINMGIHSELANQRLCAVCLLQVPRL
jgi:hypothetical protein